MRLRHRGRAAAAADRHGAAEGDAAGGGSEREAQGAAAAGFGALFVPLALQNFLMTYNSTAMNVALSSIIKDLHTTLTGVQAVISLYSLVVAALLITGSKFAARRGYQRTFVLGAEIFAVGTLITALSPDLVFMLVGWSLLQGIGIALMLPSLLALLTETLSGATRTKALAMMATIGGIGGAAGPILGGLITDYLGWRVSFLMGTVITALVVVLVRRVPDARTDRAHVASPFDLPGAALSAIGFGLLVIATLMAGKYGLLKARQDFELFGHTLLSRGGLSPVPVLAAIGLLVLIAFALWERHLVNEGRDPLVRVTVLKNRTIRAGSELQALQYLAPTGVLFLLPVFVQTALGFNALRSGIVLLPMTVGLMLSAAVAARLVANGRMSHRAAQLWSFLLLVAGCLMIAVTFDPYDDGVFTTGLAFAPGLLLIGINQGLSTMLTDLVQSAPPPEQVSDVTGLSRSSAYLGSSLGVALAGAFMTAALLTSFEAGTDDSTILTSQEKQIVKTTLEDQVQLTAASDATMRERLAARGVSGSAADELVRINADAREHALTIAVVAMAVISAGGFLVALRLPRVRTDHDLSDNGWPDNGGSGQGGSGQGGSGQGGSGQGGSGQGGSGHGESAR